MAGRDLIDNFILSRKLILVTGKGGIGKTVVAAALAKRAVQLKRKVLVVEQSAVGQLGPLLGVANVGHDEKWNELLGVANFTAGGNFRDFITKHLMKSNLLDLLVSNKVVHSFFTAIPGFAELMLLGRLYYAINLAPNKPDLVIVDCYASGHFLSLMTTPDAVLKSGLAGPITHQTQKVKDWLADSEQCITIFVGVPEELVMSETLEFVPVLERLSPVAISALIMNRCVHEVKVRGPEALSVGESFIHQRRLRQQRALEVLAKGMAGDDKLKHLPVICLPDLGSIQEPLDDRTVSELFSGGRL